MCCLQVMPPVPPHLPPPTPTPPPIDSILWETAQSLTFVGNTNRSRRVKCDEARPSCQRCLNVGRPCPGYALDLQPRPPTVARSPRALPQFSSSKDYSDLVLLGREIINLRSVFVHSHARLLMSPSEQLASYTRHLPSRSGYSVAMDSAVECVTAALRALKLPVTVQPTALTSARALYSRALSSLKDALYHPTHSVSAETLCAIDLLCIFEVGEHESAQRDLNC